MASIGGWITDFGENVGNVEKDFGQQVSNIKHGINQKLMEAGDLGQEIRKQGRGFLESFEYEQREPIIGEAKALHPNMFAQFTTFKLVGAPTLAPVTAAKIGKYVYQHRAEIKAWTKKLQNVSSKTSLKNTLTSLKQKNPLPRTTARLKKSPRIAGVMTGLIASSLMNFGQTTQNNHGEMDMITSYLPRKKKVSKERWL